MPVKGTLFLVVGPSGVGKDTLLDGAKKILAGNGFYRFCRRWITRPAEAGGEDYIPVTETEFARMVDAGEFFHHWQATACSTACRATSATTSSPAST